VRSLACRFCRTSTVSHRVNTRSVARFLRAGYPHTRPALAALRLAHSAYGTKGGVERRMTGAGLFLGAARAGPQIGDDGTAPSSSGEADLLRQVRERADAIFRGLWTRARVLLSCYGRILTTKHGDFTDRVNASGSAGGGGQPARQGGTGADAAAFRAVHQCSELLPPAREGVWCSFSPRQRGPKSIVVLTRMSSVLLNSRGSPATIQRERGITSPVSLCQAHLRSQRPPHLFSDPSARTSAARLTRTASADHASTTEFT
jgi:hypothetical protein